MCEKFINGWTFKSTVQHETRMLYVERPSPNPSSPKSVSVDFFSWTVQFPKKDSKFGQVLLEGFRYRLEGS